MGSKEVHKIIQSMSLELNSYKQRKIFTPLETQNIQEKRMKYEMKMQRLKKNLSDYQNYIKSECKLLKSREKKKENKGIPTETIDENLEKNILRIYRKAFRQFSDKELLIEFSEFCVRRGFNDILKEVMSEQLLKHTQDEEMWIFAAKKLWEIQDIESARNALIKGLGIVEQKKLLMVEFFKLEVAYADKLRRFNRDLGVKPEDFGSVENGDVAFELFKEIATNYTDVEVKQCLRISKLIPGFREKLKGILVE